VSACYEVCVRETLCLLYCFTAALLLLYCVHTHRYACERRCACFTVLRYCFTAALLLLYCVHTHRYVREALVCSEEKLRLQVLTN
jgi:hypothetical protein